MSGQIGMYLWFYLLWLAIIVSMVSR